MKKIHQGNLDLSQPHKLEFLKIKKVTGDCIFSGLLYGSKPLPRLKVIEGDLDLRDSGVFSLYKLEEVWGNIVINKNTALEDFGDLKHLNGEIYFNGNERLKKVFHDNFEKENGHYVKLNAEKEMGL